MDHTERKRTTVSQRAVNPPPSGTVGSIPTRSTDEGAIVLDPANWIRFDSLEALNAQTNAAIAEHVGCECDEPEVCAPTEGDADDFTIRMYGPSEKR